jgi:Protein of unknown function (DUF2817)
MSTESSMTVRDAFSANYAQAREKFRAAAAAAGLALQAYVHPLAGRDGEELAIDVALAGAADARRMLIISSGCHGVEGYCGSGIQVQALRDAAWHRLAERVDVAVLYVHALNPYGFSFGRRWTHENIDLNRNFHDFTQPLPINLAYRDVQRLLVPDDWPPSPANREALAQFQADRGLTALQAAVTQGQHEFPNGLFYGGESPSWSNLTFRHILRTHAGRVQQLAWIDLHTGLGPTGWGERGFAGRDSDRQALARARAWWDGGGQTPVTVLYDGSSISSPMTGLLWSALDDECPQAERTSMAMEFGTRPMLQVLDALRAEQWLFCHPDAPATQAARIKQDLRDAFYVDGDGWKAQVVAQARQAMDQAVVGLTL